MWPSLLEQAGHIEPVGADGAEALGLAEHGQHEPHVIGLAVVEQISARRLAAGERGKQLETSSPLMTRWRAGLQDSSASAAAPSAALSAFSARERRAAAPAQTLAVDGHHVIEVQADADETIGAGALEGRHDQRQRTDEVGRERDHQLALEQRLADEAEVEVLQVAQAAVDELAERLEVPEA